MVKTAEDLEGTSYILIYTWVLALVKSNVKDNLNRMKKGTFQEHS